jgi:hypothetical protein
MTPLATCFGTTRHLAGLFARFTPQLSPQNLPVVFVDATPVMHAEFILELNERKSLGSREETMMRR